MKIIDWERKGNLVRFYLGDNNCDDFWGDDWNDRPYEDNAGTVYDEYIKGIRDVVFPFDDLVLEPSNNWAYDSGYSKEDMKKKLVPCIIVVPKEIHQNSYQDQFKYYIGSEGIFKFYLGDELDETKDKGKREIRMRDVETAPTIYGTENNGILKEERKKE